jgi:hypothetical protein
MIWNMILQNKQTWTQKKRKQTIQYNNLIHRSVANRLLCWALYKYKQAITKMIQPINKAKGKENYWSCAFCLVTWVISVMRCSNSRSGLGPEWADHSMPDASWLVLAAYYGTRSSSLLQLCWIFSCLWTVGLGRCACACRHLLGPPTACIYAPQASAVPAFDAVQALRASDSHGQWVSDAAAQTSLRASQSHGPRAYAVHPYDVAQVLGSLLRMGHEPLTLGQYPWGPLNMRMGHGPLTCTHLMICIRQYTN